MPSFRDIRIERRLVIKPHRICTSDSLILEAISKQNRRATGLETRAKNLLKEGRSLRVWPQRPSQDRSSKDRCVGPKAIVTCALMQSTVGK